ncbi:hypothetical protein BT69DRAFT_1371333 [Atractiella rhizophila]|nr:hypothetical protein BT69DRAFT_1371333 [Atractiella rhizophila]
MGALPDSSFDSPPVILDDTIVLIFYYLSNRDLSTCCRTSRAWNAIAQPILERRRHFKLSLTLPEQFGWTKQQGQVLEKERQLIRSSNVKNIRHLVLWNRAFEGKRVPKDNASCISMFEILQEVAPYLKSLLIESEFPALDRAFTFPPLPMLRTLTIDSHSDNEQKKSLPLIFDDAFPYFSASSHLEDLALPQIDQLSSDHLPSDTLVSLTVTTRRGDLDEETERRISSLLHLKKLYWAFETAPTNCILPTSITHLTLRLADWSPQTSRWSVEKAFPNFAYLSNLSFLHLFHCVALSPHFPECQFKLSKLEVDDILWKESDGVFKLLHNSSASLSEFEFSKYSPQRLPDCFISTVEDEIILIRHWSILSDY